MGGRLTTARALSSLRPSVRCRVFKSGAINIELDEINSLNFLNKCVVSSQHVGTKMLITVSLVYQLFARGKQNSKGHNS